MPLPKRPSGSVAPSQPALPDFGESENGDYSESDSDFALPDLDDFLLPEIENEPEQQELVEFKQESLTSRGLPTNAAVPDSLRDRYSDPSSTDPDRSRPAQAAVSDVLDAIEDEDEETALDRELGLLDDDEYLPIRCSVTSVSDEGASAEEESGEPEPEETTYSLDPKPEESIYDSESAEDDDFLARFEESLSEDADSDDSDDELEKLLKGLEEITGESDELENSGVDISTSEVSTEDDWEAALAELESANDESALPPSSLDRENQQDEEDEEDEEESWGMEEDFVPPSNPFAIPEEFSNFEEDSEEDEEDEEDESVEDDFVPPSDPFANPFATEEDGRDKIESPAPKQKETRKQSALDSLKEKASSLLSPENIKQELSSYIARLSAEMKGEDAPDAKGSSKRSGKNTFEDDEQEESSQNPMEEDRNNDGGSRGGRKSGGSGVGRRPLAIFGFLAPIRTLYTGIVNVIFGILTSILGILAKLPLIGFVFKIALDATKVLKAVAQYIPLAFFVGALVAVSYFSVPRDSLTVAPDSGGATFAEFSYDASSNSASGIITNTGDVIADVVPEFAVKTLQPRLMDPVSWIIPEVAAICVAEAVQVDIDSTMKVTAGCSEVVTGFIPRATGELK